MRELDRIDFDILAELQKNARLPNKELAERVGVAASTCLERVRRLYAAKVLRGFHAEVEPRAIGVRLEAMISVRLARHSRKQVVAFREHVLALPEVVRVYHLGGINDFMSHVAVRGSDHLRDLALGSLTTWPEVAHLETALIFEHMAAPVFPAYPPAETAG